jgi:hypothetical protein
MIAHLSFLGNSLMDSHTGHISTVEEVKRATPSVLHTNDILAGFARNAACFLYASPSYTSWITSGTTRRRKRCCNEAQTAGSAYIISTVGPRRGKLILMLHVLLVRVGIAYSRVGAPLEFGFPYM